MLVPYKTEATVFCNEEVLLKKEDQGDGSVLDLTENDLIQKNYPTATSIRIEIFLKLGE